MFHATVLHPQYVVNGWPNMMGDPKKKNFRASGLSSLAGLPRCYPSSASPRHATLPEDVLIVWRPSIRPMLCLQDPFSSHAITGMPVCSASVDHTWNDHGREYWSQGFHFLENNLPKATVGQCRLEHLRTMVYCITVDKGNPAPVNLDNIPDKKEKNGVWTIRTGEPDFVYKTLWLQHFLPHLQRERLEATIQSFCDQRR